MPKKKETKKISKHDQWNVLISSLEVEIRYGVKRGTYVDPRPYVSVLRTMEKLGAKRGDSLGHLIDEIGEDVFSAECDKTHREWKEYERLGQLFAPHLDQHRRIKHPNPKEDFHAAWVKAGEDKEQEYLAEHERLHREFDRILKGRLRRSNEEMDAEVEQMLDEAGIER